MRMKRHALGLAYVLLMLGLAVLTVALIAGLPTAAIFVPLIAVSIITVLAGYSVGVRYMQRAKPRPRTKDPD